MKKSSVFWENRQVMRVEGDGKSPIPEQARQCFTCLEAGLVSRRGRKFYGVINGHQYHACASLLPGEENSSLPHPLWTLPGGAYTRICIRDWESRLDEIARAFDLLYSTETVDPSRPGIENYRSLRELYVMVPVLAN